jgi:hypothetical protein
MQDKILLMALATTAGFAGGQFSSRNNDVDADTIRAEQIVVRKPGTKEYVHILPNQIFIGERPSSNSPNPTESSRDTLTPFVSIASFVLEGELTKTSNVIVSSGLKMPDVLVTASRKEAVLQVGDESSTVFATAGGSSPKLYQRDGGQISVFTPR